MDILLIEDNARRRVALAKHLMNDRHRVTIASSVGEAEEILRFVKCKAAAPNAVVIAERLLRGEGLELRDELCARFPDVNLIPLRADLEFVWLARWLENLRARGAPGARLKGTRHLDIVLIEADEALREALKWHLVSRGDSVRACRTLEEARALLANLAAHGKEPHAIVSQVAVGHGDAIGFYLTVRDRFPNVRWIVTPPPPSRPTPYSRALARSALGGLDELRCTRSTVSGRRFAKRIAG